VKRRVIFDKAAARELRERRSYFGDVSPGADRRLAADLQHLLELIAEFPHLHEEYAPSLRRPFCRVGLSAFSTARRRISF